VRLCIIEDIYVDLEFQRSTSCFESVSTIITDVKALLASICTTIQTGSASSVDPTFDRQEHTTHIKLQSELCATAPVAPA
jgi:hypothetical protein